MNDLWVSVSGAIAQQRKVETIANNVANANSVGFKKDQTAFKEQLTALSKGIDDIDLPRKEWKPADFYRSYGAEDGFVEVNGTYTDFEQGQLKPTGNPLDLAISGNGFFEISTANGLRYTRRGVLSINNEGLLVDEQGHPLLSKINTSDVTNQDAKQPSPEERTIKISGRNIEINNNGEVYNDKKKVADLSVVEFNDIQALKKEGGLLFINPDTANIKQSNPTSTIHQGFLEGSNVNAISEMAELIKAHRHFENIQKAIKSYDQITGRGVNEISKL